MTAASAPLRVGRIVALNMYPVYHQLERADIPGVTFTDGLPTALNQAVLDGSLDVSAMSSIAFARNAHRLRLLPIGSVTASGAVDSIRVFSRVPFDQITSVAVTPHSATSVALLRILVGPDVTFSPLTVDPADALSEVDGVLLIADEALHAFRDPFAPHSTDLGELWRARTGLPMVFAVWAVRREVVETHADAIEAVSHVIRNAPDEHAKDSEAVVRAAAERFDFPVPFIRRYFTRLSYGFGPTERKGLTRYLELAQSANELLTVPALAA